ncbi:TonB-dependent receptor [Mucilaginibacter sp. HMF5004]|uniref:TonB-dependent receptor domain-containing protein n=1 Tax=Mucilaginibacter rivuli TaxID=2857527 RepID=UPI001C5CE046|nr:TonB-dependent receptor [Mucilaginibacter rivuli]
MKKTLLILTCLFVSYLSNAQTSKPLTIKGTVADSVKKELLSYVTITLQDAATSQQIKSVLTKEDGSFQLSAPKDKAYAIVVAFVGYRNKTVKVDNENPDLGKILLSATTKQLSEVSVTAAKPIIKQEVDRISYDVQTDPENKVMTVLDMLRKVPMISVDATDNIKLKGSGDYKILINGKESALIAKNPSDVFKAMPASNIQKIEVITTPPAKYDAEGLAGIINIITKKNADNGYNGSLNLRYSDPWGPGSNLNLTFKQGKIGFNGYVGYNHQKNNTTTSGNTNNVLIPALSQSQDASRSRNGDNLYGSGELSYEIDTLNLITAAFSQYHGSNNNINDLSASEVNSTGTQSYRLINTGKGTYTGYDMGLNYQIGFKRNKDQLLTLSYKYSPSSNTQNNDALYSQKINTGSLNNFRQNNKSGSKDQTIQVDYVQPFKVWSIEAGAKAILRNSYSDFENLQQLTGADYTIDTKQSNNLDYQQDVYSIYNSYQAKFTNWVFKGGLRIEHTSINANFASATGNTLDQRYDNLVPSFSMQRTLTKNSNLTMGYSQRINRPGIWRLNPFADKSNPKFINVGNPDLQPVKNNNIELSYSNFAKGSITLSTNFAFANNTVQNVFNFNPADSVTTSTYQNIGKNRRWGFDLNANYPLTKKLNVNINAELVHVWLSGTYGGEFYDASGNQGHIFTSTSYAFFDTFKMGFNVDYDSRYVMLQGVDNDWFGYSLSANKDLFNKKATISVYINNPFEKIKHLDYFTSSNNFVQSNYNDVLSRQISVSFQYKFGKLNSEVKKNKRGINNDDVSGNSH